jgi:hypothetical protein
MRSNDDVRSSAGDYSVDLRLLGLWHREFVKCLLQIVEKGRRGTYRSKLDWAIDTALTSFSQLQKAPRGADTADVAPSVDRVV